MATKRMLANDIIREPNFITLTPDAKALYFILNLEADDNGFVQPFTILELHKFSEEALFKLASLGYITLFMGIENQGIVNKAVVDNNKLEFAKQLNIKNIYACVIKDWFIHNSLNKNYFKPSKFKEEMKMLELNENAEIIPLNSKEYSYHDMQLENDNFLNKTYIEKKHTENKRNKMESSTAKESCEELTYSPISYKEYDTFLLAEDKRYGELKNIILKDYEYEILYLKYLEVNKLINKVSYILEDRKEEFKGSYFAYINKIAINDSWKLREEEQHEKNLAEEAEKRRIKSNEEIERQYKEEEKINEEKEIEEIMKNNKVSRQEAIKIKEENIEKTQLRFYLQKGLLLGHDEEYFKVLMEKYPEV